MLRRFLAGSLMLSLLVTQPGCMTKPPSLALHDTLLNERIALLPEHNNTVLSLEVFARSKPQGALKGAGEGIAAMLGSGGGGSCSGDICGAVLLLYLTFAVVVGGTIGAIQGTMTAPSARNAAGMESLVAGNLREFSRHVDLAQKVFARSRKIAGLRLEFVPAVNPESEPAAEEIHRLKTEGYGKVLSITIEKFHFVGDKGDDPELGLYLEAMVRIIDTDNRDEVYRREFQHFGKVRRYSEWLRMDSAALSVELNDYLETLAEEIVDSLFLAYALPVASGSWTFPGTEGYGCCWFCPVNPPFKIDYFPSAEQSWPKVSTRPQLAWQPFPDDHRQEQLQEKTGCRATNIRYDLRVWGMHGDQQGELVYQRYGLDATAHRLEQPLRSGRRYLWSVRACFDLDERVACTPWAFSLVPAKKDACESTAIAPENYYHFLVR